MKIATLNAELRPLRVGDELVDAVWMDCPRCGGHGGVVIPFADHRRTIGGTLVWQRVAGSTVDDLTLAPSYHLQGHCGLHGFVRGGEWVAA